MKLIALGLATALATAAPATAQDRASRPKARAPQPPTVAPVPRLRPTTREPFALGRPSAPRPGDPVPIPNRSLEAPRDRFADYRQPYWEPMLLPQERRQGQTFGSEHLRETGPDTPFDRIVPGARLRIPVE